MEVSGQLHAPTALLPGKKPLVVLWWDISVHMTSQPEDFDLKHNAIYFHKLTPKAFRDEHYTFCGEH
jgi:hypothetical protein